MIELFVIGQFSAFRHTLHATRTQFPQLLYTSKDFQERKVIVCLINEATTEVDCNV